MKKAFTLIELLVVIAIIAILAAILFPVFAQAKEAAKKTTCLSNNKNMATAAFLYQGDYDDAYPNTSWQQDGVIVSKQVHWTYLMQPYIKSYDIFYCPSDAQPVVPKHPCPNGQADFGKLPTTCDWMAPKNSYLTNYNVIPAHDWIPVNQSQFESPSNMVIFAEKRATLPPNNFLIGAQTGFTGFVPSQPCQGQPYIKTTEALAAADLVAPHVWTDDEEPNGSGAIDRVDWTRHSGGSNYSFTDGHAKYLKLGKVLDPNNFLLGNTWLPVHNDAAAGPC